MLHELYPSRQALDEAFAAMDGAMPESFEQLDTLLAALLAGAGRS